MFVALESHKVDLPVEGPLKLEDDIFSDDAEDKALQDDAYEIEKAEMLVEAFRITRNRQVAELLLRNNLRTSVSLEALTTMTSDTEWNLATEGFFGDLKDKIASFITKAISSIGNFISNMVGKVTGLFKKNEENANEFANTASKVSDEAVKKDKQTVKASPAKIILEEIGRASKIILGIPAALAAAYTALKGLAAAKTMTWGEIFRAVMPDVKKATDFSKYGCTIDMTDGVIHSVTPNVTSGETLVKLGYDKATTRSIFDRIKNLGIIQGLKDCGSTVGRVLHSFGSGSVRVIVGYLRFVRKFWALPLLSIVAIITMMRVVVTSYRRIARANAQAKKAEA